MGPSEERELEIATEVIEHIKASHLRSAEKVLLSVEWILREYSPIGLHDMEPSTIRKTIEKCLQRFFTLNFIKSALNKVEKAFDILGDEKVFTFLIALAYFLYIDDEFVYDKEMRKEMLSKEKELGLSVSEVEDFYAKWTTTFGDPAVLFERI